MDSHGKTETLLDEEFQRLPGVLQVNPDENVESLVDHSPNATIDSSNLSGPHYTAFGFEGASHPVP